MKKQFCDTPKKLNFTFNEFFNSDYAKQLGIRNVTSDSKILTTIMTTICCLLQPARTLCNNFTIDTEGKELDPKKKYKLIKLTRPEKRGMTITSGWRSRELIDACRKVLNVIMSSTGHPDGQCADLRRSPWSNLMLFCVLKTLQENGYLEFDQLIYEYDSNCCHVGYRAGRNRKEVMIRERINGRFKYTNV